MLQIPVSFNSFSPRADRSVSLKFTSLLEVPNEFYTELAEHRGLTGWLLFSEQHIKEAPKEQIDDTEKRPSKRLRNTLFILWTQQGEKGNFEQYYAEKMEKFIERVKSSLD